MIINNDSRFWSKVVKTDTCWNWIGSTNGVGYGEMRINYKKKYAHRISYELHKGEIPAKYTIDHLCRNRGCVNPAHLEAVPYSVNMKRAMPFRKDTTKANRLNGHDMNDSYVRKDGKGRNCRACNLERVKEYQRNKRVTS